jgi:predicted anti-sigma-YlaC factor YlaD
MAHNEKCHELLASLSDYVDGVLEEQLCLEIDRHMASCENCRIVVDTLRKTISLYRTTTKPPEVPTEVRERLYRRLNLEDYQR